jgi:hypothetical protein
MTTLSLLIDQDALSNFIVIAAVVLWLWMPEWAQREARMLRYIAQYWRRSTWAHSLNLGSIQLIKRLPVRKGASDRDQVVGNRERDDDR